MTVHPPHEIMWNANLMQQGNFIDIFLARHVSGTYTHHQEHWMLSCSIWFSALSFWMGGGPESRSWVVCLVRMVPCDHYPSKNSVQKTICCNSTSNAHDDGRMYPKHVAKITLIKLPCCIKLAFQIISSCIYLIIAHLTDRILYC